MRSSIVLPLIAVLELGACKKESVVAKDESVESVANKVAAAKMTPRPGRWEASMKLGKMDIPGMPAEAKAAMNKQMNVTQTFASCLTPEQAAKPDGGFFQKGAENCKYDHFVMSGGRIDAAMTCKEQGSELKMTMAGTYTETAYDIQIKSNGEVQPGHPMSMEMGITARHAGECTGKEET